MTWRKKEHRTRVLFPPEIRPGETPRLVQAVSIAGNGDGLMMRLFLPDNRTIEVKFTKAGLEELREAIAIIDSELANRPQEE